MGEERWNKRKVSREREFWSSFSNLIDKRETSKVVFVLGSVLVLVFVLGGVLVSATKRERGSERGERKQRGSDSRKRSWVELLCLTSNNSDKRDTLETNLVLVLVCVLAFVLGDVLVTAIERERGSEGGEMKWGRSLSEKRVLVKILCLISDLNDERKTLGTTLVLVLILVFVLVLVFVPVPSTDSLASNVVVITAPARNGWGMVTNDRCLT